MSNTDKTLSLDEQYQKAIKYLQETQPNCELGFEFLEHAEYSPSQMKTFQEKVIEMAQIQNDIFQLNIGTGSRCHLKFDITLSMHLCSDKEVHLID